MNVLSPLPYKEIKLKFPWHQRVLSFDPSQISERLKLNHFKRTQTVQISILFPQEEGLCRCGCNNKLPKNRKSWATDDCQKYAYAVANILIGRTETIRSFLKIYYGWECQDCGCKDTGHTVIRTSYNGSKYEDSISLIKIDHIVPVKHGGGGCWLSNYRLRCHSCHKDKTNKDFGWKSKLTSHEPQIR